MNVYDLIADHYSELFPVEAEKLLSNTFVRCRADSVMPVVQPAIWRWDYINADTIYTDLT